MTRRRTPTSGRSGTRGVAATLALGTVLLCGCGEARVDAADDLCVQYDQLVEKADSLQEIDPDTATVGEVRDQVEEVQDQLDALQAVAEGQLDTLISTLRTAVGDLVAAASDAGQEALDVARPLIEDTVDDVREAWATLEQAADVKCGEA
ncbi:hypothetical protein [Nocardioides sp. YIM 152315]|uniref:hypothetical protein n=1 Tax=Nocardioides sp. YIM 152315 TaxID=3031760 RepID=UPI0023DBC6DB|nr:hypothetical protein [Nocardioides sp. YIM 152315]MDF1602086.1 hypothetical protein [Nocardioides sp. YIM 152315]